VSEIAGLIGREKAGARREVVAFARLLGGFSLTATGGENLAPRGKKARCILAILLLSPSRGVSRSRLMGLLWSDRGKEQARGSLRQSLKEIRRSLGDLADELLVADRDHVRLRTEAVRCDIHQIYEDNWHQTNWQGPLLDGVDAVDHAFDDWLAIERTRVSDRWLRNLESRLDVVAATEETGNVLRAAEEVIAFDPAHEVAHRAAIHAYAEMGQVPAALRQFEKLRDALKRFLDASPSAESIALVEQIRRGSLDQRAAGPERSGGNEGVGPPPPMDPILHRVAAHPFAGPTEAFDEMATEHPDGVRRKLAVIVFVEIVSVSEPHGHDDCEASLRRRWLGEGALSRQFTINQGRVVKETEAGLLLEFDSALNAVKFALAVQSEQCSQLFRTAEEMTTSIRIAANLGDISIRNGEAYGDGVTVAARLLSHCAPGEIVISAIVRDQVQDQPDLQVLDLGFLTLKSIERRVRAFKISSRKLVAPASVPARNHQPSIAVLPLRTLGVDPPAAYFSEGIVHDIVSCLASVQEMFVVSSTSTVGISANPSDVSSVCYRLGVRYLLTGSISQAEQRLRVRVELSDADNRSVIWTDRYEFGHLELFNIQETIAMKVVYALLPRIRFVELQRAIRKAPENLDAYDLLLQGIYSLYRLQEDDFETSRTLIRKALDHDPEFATANAMMAKWYILLVGEGRSKNVVADSQEALRYATLALQENPSDPLALSVFGHTQSFLFAQYNRALEAFDRAITTSPNSEIAWGFSAPTYCYIGEGETAIERAEHALALSPLEPFAYYYRSALTLAHYINGTFDESVFWGQKTMAEAPRFTANMRPLIASLVALERMEEARTVAAEMIKVDPGFSIDRFCRWYPLKQTEERQRLARRLRRAGLPD